MENAHKNIDNKGQVIHFKPDLEIMHGILALMMQIFCNKLIFSTEFVLII